MTFSVAGVEQAVRRVRATGADDLSSLAAPRLRELLDEMAALRKETELSAARVAAEIASRSEGVAPSESFARRQGHRSAEALIASVESTSNAAAARLIEIGRLLAEEDAREAEQERLAREAERQAAEEEERARRAREAALRGAGGGGGGGGEGMPLPLPLPTPTPRPVPVLTLRQQARSLVGAAVREGSITGDVASVVLDLIGELPEDELLLQRVEHVLRRARGLRLHSVRKLCWQVIALADPQGWVEREKSQYECRRADLRDNADGTVTLTAVLPPVDAARIKAVLDAGVRRLMAARRDPGQLLSDERTAPQMRADLLVGVFSHMAGCDQPATGVKTTVVVRMTIDQLREGAGVGEIDGVNQPVSVEELRKAAVDSSYLPVVLGGSSRPLDVGRAERAFTSAQRHALVERDGGCSWCNAPPSWCDAHHLDPWSRGGRTDLSNGLLLCRACHTRLHDNHWQIRVRAGRPEFIPPADVDRLRRPVPGGRARFEVERDVVMSEDTRTEERDESGRLRSASGNAAA